MIFVDSTVPMYLVGFPHPNQDRAIALLTQLVHDQERFVTSAEVYQEILHRYTAIQRPDAIDKAFESLGRITDKVLTFGMTEIRSAPTLLADFGGLSTRDGLHVADMQKAGVKRKLSFDTRLDVHPGIDRLR